MSELRTAGVRIHGRVQGVGFRAWTQREAASLGLTGYVRNRGDGSVEALMTGPPEVIDAMIEKCRRGPTAAVVASVEVSERAEGWAPEGFSILPTL